MCNLFVNDCTKTNMKIELRSDVLHDVKLSLGFEKLEDDAWTKDLPIAWIVILLSGIRTLNPCKVWRTLAPQC